MNTFKASLNLIKEDYRTNCSIILHKSSSGGGKNIRRYEGSYT